MSHLPRDDQKRYPVLIIDNSVLILRHVKLLVFFPFRKESNVFSVDLGINQIRTQRCIDASIKSFPFYFRLIFRD